MPAMVQDDSKHTLIQPNAQHQYSVTPADLPLSCPMPGMYLWNSHPRLYLQIEATGWWQVCCLHNENTTVQYEQNQ